MSRFELWLLWLRKDGGGAVTGHEEIVASSGQEAVSAAVARADALFSGVNGVAMLLDEAGELIWSRRSGIPQPSDPVGF